MRRAAVALTALAAVALAPAPRAEDAGGAGWASFQHGGRRYRLPLRTIDLEEVRAAGRAEVHVSLVYRDARSRVLALAFVHRGPGRVPGGTIDLTVSTPSGVSRYRAARSTCELDVTAAGPGTVEGGGRCRGLTGYDGARASPDVVALRFAARGAARGR